MTPKTRKLDNDFLADQIDAMAVLMWALAERMAYYAGFNKELAEHSRDMAGASQMVRGWARSVRKPRRAR